MAATVVALRAAIAIVVAAKLTALRRGILGRGEISPTGTAFPTAAALPPAPPAPASAAAAIASSPVVLALAVIAAVPAAIIAGTPGIILSRVETRREILRSGSVGLGLALFSCFRVLIFPSREGLASGGLSLRLGNVLTGESRGLLRQRRFVFRGRLRMRLDVRLHMILMAFVGASERLARKQLDG